MSYLHNHNHGNSEFCHKNINIFTLPICLNTNFWKKKTCTDLSDKGTLPADFGNMKFKL